MQMALGVFSSSRNEGDSYAERLRSSQEAERRLPALQCLELYRLCTYQLADNVGVVVLR